MDTKYLMAMSTAELVELHNSLGPNRPATANTFASNAKLVARIESLRPPRAEQTEASAETTEPAGPAEADAEEAPA